MINPVALFKNYVGGKLLKYAWCRKFAAKRSRASKVEEPLCPEVESYSPLTPPNSELERYKRVLVARKKREEEIAIEDAAREELATRIELRLQDQKEEIRARAKEIGGVHSYMMAYSEFWAKAEKELANEGRNTDDTQKLDA